MKFVKIAALSAILLAGVSSAAFAGDIGLTVQQINQAPQTATVNAGLLYGTKKLEITAAVVGNNTSVTGDANVTVGGPGWVSNTTGIGGQNNNAKQVATANVALVAAKNLDVGTQAIGNAADVTGAGAVVVNNTLSQRNGNADQIATTNVLLVGASKDLNVSAVAAGNSLNVKGGSIAVPAGASNAATLQINDGGIQVATVNGLGVASGDDASFASQAFGNSFSGEAGGVGLFNTTQSNTLGDSWHSGGVNTQIATTNLVGGLFGGKVDVSSAAFGNTASFAGAALNVNAVQDNYSTAQIATTNVGLAGFGGATSIGASAVGNSVVVKR